jgi:hypothetical protein
VRPSILVLPALLAILPISCAKQQFPPGGPEDKTPPEIVLTDPDHGSVGVGLQPTITISFSERMDKKRIREAIFVSPPPDGDLRVGWKRNDLRIEFTDSLAPDKTYLVTIGSAATDEHNNRLEESFTLAFSTGVALDSGSISGSVRESGASVSGATIAAYDMALVDSDRLLAEPPEYMTQSGSEGGYRLDYVSSGDYVLFAFVDRNHNRTWDPPGERIGFPTSPALLSSDQILTSDLDFDIFQRDTVPLRVGSASIARNRVLRIELSQAALRRDVLQSVILLVSADSGDTVRVEQVYAWDDTVRSITAVVPDLSGADEYYLQIDSLTDLWGNGVSTVGDSIALQPPVGSDRHAPKVEVIDPPNGSRDVEITPRITVRYDEPVMLVAHEAGLTLVDPDSAATVCARDLVDPFTISFTPDDTLRAGTAYDAILALEAVSDPAGNLPADSTVRFSFETIDPDSLGSFSGTVLLQRITSREIPKVFFGRLPAGQWAELEYDPAGRFHHDVTAGTYRFVGFVDRNGDGFLSTGRLSPFEYAEPLLSFSDTVTVRPRFETEDIELNVK